MKYSQRNKWLALPLTVKMDCYLKGRLVGIVMIPQASIGEGQRHFFARRAGIGAYDNYIFDNGRVNLEEIHWSFARAANWPAMNYFNRHNNFVKQIN